MWQGPERRSRASRLARALVAMKREADMADAELDEVPRWRRAKRAELDDTAAELRRQERRLLEKLGGR
jgi:hypothetical protein